MPHEQFALVQPNPCCYLSDECIYAAAEMTDSVLKSCAKVNICQLFNQSPRDSCLYSTSTQLDHTRAQGQAHQLVVSVPSMGLQVRANCIQQLLQEARPCGLNYRLLSGGRHCICEYMLPKLQTTRKINKDNIQWHLCQVEPMCWQVLPRLRIKG